MDEDKTKSQKQEDEELDNPTSPVAPETSKEQIEELEEEETPEEVVTTPEEEEEPEDLEEEEEPALTPRQNKRLEQLTKKLSESNQPQVQTRVTPDQAQQLINEGDYTTEELNQIAQQYGDQRYNEGAALASRLAFETNLKIDAPRVASKYDRLDQNSDNFDPGLTTFVNELYLKSVGYNPSTGVPQNPNISYEEFADGFMQATDTAATAKAASSRANLTKQAAKTGLRPGGAAKKPYQGGDPKQMSDTQLSQAINDMLNITPR